MEKIEDTETQGSPVPFFNRELSWLDFNERVLEEGLRKDLPLLERFRFLCIVSSNFNEFFRIRVAAIKEALRSAAAEHQAELFAIPDDLKPAIRIKRISEKVHAIIRRQFTCLNEEIFPSLAENGLELLRPDSYSLAQMDYLESYFINRIYPVLTPLRVEEGMNLPAVLSHNVSAAFLLAPETDEPEPEGQQIVVIRIPPSLNRIIRLPAAEGMANHFYWTLLDDVLLTWGGYLFPGFRIKESMLFKVNRDADFSVDEKRDEDFIEAMAEVLEDREKSNAVQMIYSPGSRRLRDEFAEKLSLDEDDLYEVDGPVNLGDLMDLVNISGFDALKESPWKIYHSAAFDEEAPIWDRISQGDVMLHLPYQSFDPVIRFFHEAAIDPFVVSIKTTLYRTSGEGSSAVSPIVRALEQAALNGKQVTALVELKARFDEERNIAWANRLEKAGVIVIYGLSHLKVHTKVTLVIRREQEKIKRYVHLSTGNYNDNTAKLYEDIGLFTCREEIVYDTGLLFNMLTGYSGVQTMQRLVISPTGMKRRLLELIDREARRSGYVHVRKITAKLNALTDPDIINALYHASMAGVQISLCVRGICTLVPGVPGLSENIRVISVVDHYLEHSRIIYFANGGAEELYLSSADWMPRNLDRRVELMFPVQDEKIRGELCSILNAYFSDNCQARVLNTDGAWTRLKPSAGEKPFRVQKNMLARAARESGNPEPVKPDFTVRRRQTGTRD